jgi:fructose-1,6-bisphosphatase
MKMLKLNMVLLPIVSLGMIYFYPPMTKEEQKKARAQYEQKAGWKS